MTNDPPPGPDWVMGDDGHWKPPPFTLGQGAPAGPVAGFPPPPPGAAPPGSAHPGASPLQAATLSTRPVRSTATVVALVVGALGVGFTGLIVVCILAVTFLGTSSEAKFETVGSSIDVGSGGAGSGGGLGPGVDPYDPYDPDGADGAVGEPATDDPGLFCPTWDELGGILTSPLGGATTPRTSDTTRISVNGVAHPVHGCAYVRSLEVLAVDGVDGSEVVEAVAGSSGPATVTDAGLDIPAVAISLPATSELPEATEAVLLSVDGQGYLVVATGLGRGDVQTVVGLVRDRVG